MSHGLIFTFLVYLNFRCFVIKLNYLLTSHPSVHSIFIILHSGNHVSAGLNLNLVIITLSPQFINNREQGTLQNWLYLDLVLLYVWHCQTKDLKIAEMIKCKQDSQTFMYSLSFVTTSSALSEQCILMSSIV